MANKEPGNPDDHEIPNDYSSGSDEEPIKSTKRIIDDSSEEESDDDEEEAERIRDGFIVDDDEEDEGEEGGSDNDEPDRRKKHRKNKKRRRDRERSSKADENDGALDEDDLELLMENSGARPEPTSSNFKRLKRAEEESDQRRTGLDEMFSDEENESGVEETAARTQAMNEFEDFIEEDEFSDEDEREEAAARKRSRKAVTIDPTSISEADREKLHEIYEIFGDGADYDWALQVEEEGEDGLDLEGPTELKEVFEYAELKERMLTDEDNAIRILDIPERYQKYRHNITEYDLSEENLEREKEWVSKRLLLERTDLAADLETVFKEAVGNVIQYIVVDSLEVPFIWTHRRDYLLNSVKTIDEDGQEVARVDKLLNEDDLWRIVQLDIEFHSLFEKRLALSNLYNSLNIDDEVCHNIEATESMVEIQDLMDYLLFNYSSIVKDNSLSTDTGMKKHSKFGMFDKMKNNVLYEAVKAFGISAPQFGENIAQGNSNTGGELARLHAVDDPIENPKDLVERLCKDPTSVYSDPKSALLSIRQTFSEELFYTPKLRSTIRSALRDYASINIAVTEKGKSKIDDHSPYADFKYAINRTPGELTEQPEIFLRMLEAESSGLVSVNIELSEQHHEGLVNWLFGLLKSDGFSQLADEWNNERKDTLRMAVKKIQKMATMNMKEDLRRECERIIFYEIRNNFTDKIDQAPYPPSGYDKGTIPSVLTLSFGKGGFEDAVVGCLVKESGKVNDFFKFENHPTSRSEEIKIQFVGEFKKVIQDYAPDVIAVSGYNASTKRFFDRLNEIINDEHITVAEDKYAEYDTRDGKPPLIEVLLVQDETARLYENSDRAGQEFPDKSSLVRYCIGLGRFVQSPLLEYVSLGDDLASLLIYKHQNLIGRDLILEAIETSLVDIVNMVGVDINATVRNEYAAKCLPYVAGLGPRKASGLIQNIISKLGSNLSMRSQLIEYEITSANIFMNCSSFLKIPHEGRTSRIDNIELLDGTRIHPEDYDLANKMAADALELDEEDLQDVEKEGGVIYELLKKDATKLDDLNLVEYGDELESKRGIKKRATLQMIKEEIINNYEELRRSYKRLNSYEIFEVLTGESSDSYKAGVVVPVTIRKIGGTYLFVSTSFGITGDITSEDALESNDGRRLSDVFGVTQVFQAAIKSVDYDKFTSVFSLRSVDIEQGLGPKFDKYAEIWDFTAEQSDKQAELEKLNAERRARKNVNHPLFHNFNSLQAEEFLAPKDIGDAVIRPSSKGFDHLAVTWKVANNIFQHLDVKELGKESEDDVPQGYKVGDKTFIDLDELVVDYVIAIARNVDKMVNYEKFLDGSRDDVEAKIDSFSIANPKQSVYRFCYDYKKPGWFLLLFKVSPTVPIRTWNVRAEPNGYTMAGYAYPDMIRLCNGFKTVFRSMAKDHRNRASGRTPNSRTPVRTPTGGYGTSYGNGYGANYGQANPTYY